MPIHQPLSLPDFLNVLNDPNNTNDTIKKTFKDGIKAETEQEKIYLYTVLSDWSNNNSLHEDLRELLFTMSICNINSDGILRNIYNFNFI
jgi:hypothetical protein